MQNTKREPDGWGPGCQPASTSVSSQYPDVPKVLAVAHGSQNAFVNEYTSACHWNPEEL